jgi:hypothetical protein
MKSNVYLDSLQNYAFPQLEGLSDINFQQEGAPSNFVDMRNAQFPNKRTGTEESISLLSLSHGLSRFTICALSNMQMIRCTDPPKKCQVTQDQNIKN